MKEIIGAFATDNGTEFIDRHFGDASKYLLYKINSSSAEYVETIENTVEEEEEETEHGDQKKAGGISALLKQKGVQMTVAPVYGPNLKRIKKKFISVIVKETSIAAALTLTQNHFDEIIAEWEKGEERDFLSLK
ncbi:MAG: hypothetical protein JXR86_18460 [Spirochaetales bacterium]|nr:hypothetical protein [Spirochaetales bacterium]